MIPTSAHNEALTGDTLYSAFLNHEWRTIVLPFIVQGMAKIAAGIEDESERQDFEVLYGAMIDDFYNEEIVDGTPVGSIVAFVGTDLPNKWEFCSGDELPISTYPDLYALIGDTFGAASGGNFKLPDLRSRFVYGTGLGSEIGDTGGAATHTLTTAEIPTHTHDVGVSAATGAGNRVARGTNTVAVLQATSSVGGGDAHNNMPPYIKTNFIIKILP